MKVVLLKSRKHLGKIGDVVEVKNGFGRNFLIPEGVATRATKENLAVFEGCKHELEEKNSVLHNEAVEVQEKINGKDFVFISQSSDDGRLFGSVSAKDISGLVKEVAPSIHHSNIVLGNPLKTLGIFEVNVHLHIDVDAVILINIARTEAEAQEAIKKYKLKNNKAEEATEESTEEAA